MRIKGATALAYLHQLEDQKIKNQVASEHFLWKGEVEHFIKTGCPPKKNQFEFTSKIKILCSEFNSKISISNSNSSVLK